MDGRTDGEGERRRDGGGRRGWNGRAEGGTEGVREVIVRRGKEKLRGEKIAKGGKTEKYRGIEREKENTSEKVKRRSGEPTERGESEPCRGRRKGGNHREGARFTEEGRGGDGGPQGRRKGRREARKEGWVDGAEERRNNESSREEGVDHKAPGAGSEIPENTAQRTRGVEGEEGIK